MAKQRNKFSEHSKPMQVLIILGACTWGLIFMAIANAPKKVETPEEIRKKEVTRMIADIRTECDFSVKKYLKVKNEAKIPLFQGRVSAADEYGLQYKYQNIVSAKNSFGVKLEQPFECHILFSTDKAAVKYLKIGNQIFIN